MCPSKIPHTSYRRRPCSRAHTYSRGRRAPPRSTCNIAPSYGPGPCPMGNTSEGPPRRHNSGEGSRTLARGCRCRRMILHRPPGGGAAGSSLSPPGHFQAWPWCPPSGLTWCRYYKNNIITRIYRSRRQANAISYHIHPNIQ